MSTTAAMPSRTVTMMARLRSSVEVLHPAYFAMVMATGVVAIAANWFRLRWIAVPLGILNVGAFIVLTLMTLTRVLFYPGSFLRDLTDHTRGVGFFTIVAATGVLGTQFILIFGQYKSAAVLWFASIILWVGFTYAIFTSFTIKEQKPTLADGINGGWLLAVVATQAVANLGTWLLPGLTGYTEPILFFSLALWLCGGMLYIWMISLIFYRYTFFRFLPSDLMPPYWINMGAMAISTLVGANLVKHAGMAPFMEGFVPFLKGFTVLFWATATWWIPMLFILALWRHGYKKFKFAYNPLYWGAVFPLGMYTVATLRLSEAMRLPFLSTVSEVFIYFAVTAWLLTFAGLVGSLASFLRPGAGRKCTA
jgi:tellurite resistance protein TehA-like permease